MLRRDLTDEGKTLLFAAATAIENDMEVFGQDLAKAQAACQSFSDKVKAGEEIDMALLEEGSVTISIACQILNKKYDGVDAAQKDLLKNYKKKDEVKDENFKKDDVKTETLV